MPLLTDQNLTVISVRDIKVCDILRESDEPFRVVVRAGATAEVLHWSYNESTICVRFNSEDVLVERLKPLMTTSVWLMKECFFE
jgi:hypothetical protein